MRMPGRLSLADNDEDWVRAHPKEAAPLASFDAVLMRKDPPFDMEYLTSVWLLSQAEREGARVFNNPARGARPQREARHPGIPAVHRADAGDARPGAVHAFIDEQRDVILKRLDGMGGESIFRVHRR